MTKQLVGHLLLTRCQLEYSRSIQVISCYYYLIVCGPRNSSRPSLRLIGVLGALVGGSTAACADLTITCLLVMTVYFYLFVRVSCTRVALVFKTVRSRIPRFASMA